MKSVWIRLSGDTFMVTLCLIPHSLIKGDEIYQEYTSSKDIWICRICRRGTRFMVPENSWLLFVVHVLLFVICYLDILVTTEALKKWLCQHPADGFPDAKKETERDVKNFSCGGRCSSKPALNSADDSEKPKYFLKGEYEHSLWLWQCYSLSSSSSSFPEKWLCSTNMSK